MMKQNALVQIARRLWDDESGAVMSMEMVLIGSVVLLGLMVGLAAYRDSVINELSDIGRGVSSLNQSYSFTAEVGGDDLDTGVTRTYGTAPNQVEVTVSAASSQFVDTADFCDDVTITRTAPGANETTAPPAIP